MTAARLIRSARFIVRDLSLIASYVSGAIACAAIAKACWMLVWAATDRVAK